MPQPWKQLLFRSLFVGAAALIAACSGEPAGGGAGKTDAGYTPAVQFPTLSISSPAEAAEVPLGTDSDLSVDVAFSVSRFTLKAPGECAGAANCGHVHLNIDADACNAQGAPYNNAGAASPIVARFAQCATAAGAHTLKLSLHNDDHSPVEDADGAAVTATRTVTTIEVATGVPAIAITSPASGSAVSLGADADNSVPVAFTVENFDLKAPGTCGSAEKCGHVHLNIDEDACNAQGAPYNNAGASSPIDAKFGACAVAGGGHTVKLSLHNDDHSAVVDANNAPVVASSRVFTCASGQPCVNITSPGYAATVALGTDADKSVPVHFALAGFTLKAPGTCAGAENCGHAHLNVDGSACNADGAPYNNAGAASPLEAKLGRCANPTGAHVVRISLHNDDHSPVAVNGSPVGSGIRFNTVESGAPAISITTPARGAVMPLGSDGDQSVQVDYAVQNFTLKAPGSCGADANCGHVHLLIDGEACNAQGAPYNNAGAAGPLAAKFATCAVPAGQHVVTVELHKDDHSAVTDASGRVVSASREFNTVAGAAPSISITGPSERSIIPFPDDTDKGVAVTYAVRNFSLKAPGTCGGEANCGHVHLNVDGNTCNAQGAPYNNAGAGGPIVAKLGLCPDPAGTHRVTLSLHNDDHSPVVDGATEVQAHTTFTACQRGQACIGITSPSAAAVVSAGSDTGKSVLVDYAVENFTLKAPGTCSGAASCGHIHMLVDGTACNAQGAPYNNAGAAGPTAAQLALCGTATGEHGIAVELHNDDHSPVNTAAGNPVSSSTQVLVK